MGRYNRIPDDDLLRMYHDGNAEVLDYIMEKYKDLVKKKARAMFLIGGETEDLIQEGMIGLMKAVRDYEPSKEASFLSFAELCISRQMYTAIEASLRKKHMPLNSYISIYDEGNNTDEGKHQPLIDTIEPVEENNPEAIYFAKEFSEIFMENLKKNLSDLENRVLYLHLMGTEYKKIAELLDKPPKTIDNALQRIRSKAEKLLKLDK